MASHLVVSILTRIFFSIVEQNSREKNDLVQFSVQHLQSDGRYRIERRAKILDTKIG